MAKFITEILDEVNADIKKLNDYKDDAALKFVFEYAFDEDKKMDLPDGAPPYKPDSAPDFGMSPATLRMETKKLYVFNRKDLKPIRKEQLFISLLESVHPKEAELLIAVKDQKLHKMYPKITRTVLEGLGFIKPKVKTEDK